MKDNELQSGRVRRIFERRFLREAAAPGAERTVDQEIGGKLGTLEGRTDRSASQLRQVLGKLQVVWAQRDKLEKRYVVYLIAAFLYFISPLDAIPDPIPVVGYADDLAVAIFVLELVVKALKTIGNEGTAALRDKVEDWALNTFVRKGFDAATEAHMRRSVAAVAIGLWGATTAGAISLGVASALGATPTSGIAYILIVSVLVCAWNAAVATLWVRRFTLLDGDLQNRIFQAAASRLGVRELAAIGIPAVLLVALGAIRLLASAPTR